MINCIFFIDVKYWGVVSYHSNPQLLSDLQSCAVNFCSLFSCATHNLFWFSLTALSVFIS